MTLKSDKSPKCAECAIPIKEKACISENGRGPDFCPTLNLEALIEGSLKEYEKQDIRSFARMASIQEAECYVNRGTDNPHVFYAVKPRIQETIEFANKMNYRRIGMAFCVGLRHEARTLNDILKMQGFDVVSVACNVGCKPKEFLGLGDEHKVALEGFEAICNPVTQAKILNAAETDFNIVLGLCVGHDSLFFKYANAMCTVLAAKDRVTGHNPLAALYLAKSYYKKLRLEKLKKGGYVETVFREFEE